MFRYLTLVALIALSFSTAKAGFLGDYYTGGNMIQNVGYITFTENGGVGTEFDAGDVVIMIQDFSNLGGTSISGSNSGNVPKSVYGITAFKASVGGYTNTSTGFAQSARHTLEATGGFGAYLTSLGIDTSGVSVGSSSAFALVSNVTSDVTLKSDGTTDFSGFEANLIAGFDGGDDFAQTTVAANNDFIYDFYDPAVNVSLIAAFNFRYGLSVESVDDLTGFGSTIATPFSGSPASVQLTTLATTATSSAASYTGGSAYYGDFDGDLRTISSVPEPSSIAALSTLLVVGFVSRRRRK
jgi:hypothetical protein